MATIKLNRSSGGVDYESRLCKLKFQNNKNFFFWSFALDSWSQDRNSYFIGRHDQVMDKMRLKQVEITIGNGSNTIGSAKKY